MSPSVPSGTLDDKKLILMVLERTVVFFDAGYLSKLSKYFGKGKYLKLDLGGFAKHLAEKQRIWGILNILSMCVVLKHK